MEQNYSNHARFQWPYHYVLVPVLLVNFIIRIVLAFQGFSWLALWEVVLAFFLMWAAFLIRFNALRVQDRVIRLEERLRCQALAPELEGEFDRLSQGQVVALRFASNGEFAEVLRSAKGKSSKEIKQGIKNWRADYFRV